MTDAWDQLWSAFTSAVEHLNAAVEPEASGFVNKLERSANDVFPLRAMASYSPRSSPGDERLVISLDVSRDSKMVAGRADLARGDGVVLDEVGVLGPSAEIEFIASPRMVTDAALALAAFVERQRDAVIEELASGP